MVEQSWERVFDIESLRRSRLWGPSLDLQGVVEEVRIAEVTRVDQFTAR